MPCICCKWYMHDMIEENIHSYKMMHDVRDDSLISVLCTWLYTYTLTLQQKITILSIEMAAERVATLREGNLQELVQQAGRQLGIATLTGDQERAVCEFASGHDVFVCLPTGSGKSICYALLPLLFDFIRGKTGSICLIVSPIVALMKDQVSSFQSRGMTAAFCGSEQRDKDTQEGIRRGRFQLVYATPEALVDSAWYRSMLLESVWQENLVAFVVDEAHCIKTW